MKCFTKTLLFSFLLSFFIFSCETTPKKMESEVQYDASILEKIEELRATIAKYDLEIYDIDNYNKAEAEYKNAKELSAQEGDKQAKKQMEKSYANAYDFYKITIKNAMPLYASAQRASAIKERDKANSILSHRTANKEYENAALVFFKGEDDVVAENYEQAAANYIESRIGYESSYNIAKAYYDKSAGAVKELDQSIKEIKNIQAEIDSYQGSKL